MKRVSNWLDVMVESTVEKNNKMSQHLMILLVLFIGAGSLYMLLNTTG